MRRTFSESETCHPRGSRRFESRKVRHAIRLMLSNWQQPTIARPNLLIPIPLCSTCYGKGKLPTNCRACHGTVVAS